MTIYEILIDHVSQGGGYSIDLRRKTLKIGKQYVVENGEVILDRDLINEIDIDPWDYVAELYKNFKHSIPKSSYKGNSYFRALSYEELSSYDMVFGDDRYLAQAKLEGFILLASLSGILKWKWSAKWFWQYELDKELVVLKEWIQLDKKYFI